MVILLGSIYFCGAGLLCIKHQIGYSMKSALLTQLEMETRRGCISLLDHLKSVQRVKPMNREELSYSLCTHSKKLPLNADTQTLMYNTIQILKLFVYDSNSIVIMFGTRVIGSPHIASMFLWTKVQHMLPFMVQTQTRRERFGWFTRSWSEVKTAYCQTSSYTVAVSQHRMNNYWPISLQQQVVV